MRRLVLCIGQPIDRAASSRLAAYVQLALCGQAAFSSASVGRALRATLGKIFPAQKHALMTAGEQCEVLRGLPLSEMLAALRRFIEEIQPDALDRIIEDDTEETLNAFAGKSVLLILEDIENEFQLRTLRSAASRSSVGPDVVDVMEVHFPNSRLPSPNGIHLNVVTDRALQNVADQLVSCFKE